MKVPPQAPKASITRFQLNTLSLSLESSERLAYLRKSFGNALYNSGSFSEVIVEPTPVTTGNVRGFDIVLTPKFVQEFRPILWYLGVFTGLGPFWPAMPRKGVISLEMKVGISQDGVRIQNVSMTEEEPFDFFWYGPYRYFALQDQTDHLYRKLLARLTNMLSKETIPGDASGLVEEQGNGQVALMEATPANNPASMGTGMNGVLGTSASAKVFSVAVMDPECSGVDSLVGQTLNTKLRTELFGTGNFQILERGRMQDILTEQGYQQSGLCNSTECYVKVGQLVGVDAIFVASYGRAGNVSLLTLRAISVETGSVLEEVSAEVSGGDEKLLTEGVPTLVRKLRVENLRK